MSAFVLFSTFCNDITEICFYQCYKNKFCLLKAKVYPFFIVKSQQIQSKK